MPEFVLTSQNNGATHTLKPGTQIAIHLEENPSTGYVWTVDGADEEVVTVADAGYQPPEGPAIGQGGMHAFLVTAKSPGTAEIRLKHWRSWQGERSVTERFRVTISVIEASPAHQGG